ncbi:hypothetical protein [Micromonospora sp. NPDC051006]|uniref:hypothetical protein n=1 Tax=Micromonospora sp. NPDC051006 TaxID=3364283 RepID=UPI003791C0D5
MSGRSARPLPRRTLLRGLLRRRHHKLHDTDPERILALVESGRTARSDAAELTELAVSAAAGLIAEEPSYAKLAAPGSGRCARPARRADLTGAGRARPWFAATGEQGGTRWLTRNQPPRGLPG